MVLLECGVDEVPAGPRDGLPLVGVPEGVAPAASPTEDVVSGDVLDRMLSRFMEHGSFGHMLA